VGHLEKHGVLILMRHYAIASVLVAYAVRGEEPRKLDYGRDVRPILSENCFHCHGQDSKKRMAGLRLDTFDGAAERRSGKQPLVAGRPEASEVFQRVTAQNPARRMPPVSSNRTLTAEQIATLKRWIEEGAAYTNHWAFQPPKRPMLPVKADARWAKQPMDAFVSARLVEENLRPSSPAPPWKWLRRVSLDLTGLPPTPAEIDDFTEDLERRGEGAYAAVVDRLMASPRYGERMAMDWLDVARYADTHGFNNDAARSMWRWRDWVIANFNANLPYDRFLTEQLAGDLLPNATLDQLIATGYGRNHVINSEGGIIEEEYRVEYVADRVRTLGMSWLGLTLECARCHDHKYDPITQRDYYRFFAFFNNVPELGEDGRVANAVPLVAAPTASQQARMREIESEIAPLETRLQKRARQWKWSASQEGRALRLGSAIKLPGEPALRLDCESAKDFEKGPEAQAPLVQGIAGNACVPSTISPKPRTANKVPLSKRRPFTWTAWVRPSPADFDAALLSTIEFDTSPAATTYGRGIEFRLKAGELEFAYSDRFPAYSVRVRSDGARITPEQWRHLTLVYEGASKDAVRAEPAWIRIFVDGIEVPTRILNEGLSVPEAKNDKASPIAFRIGWDSAPKSAQFGGRLDEVAFWTSRLTDPEVEAVFRSRAIPYAVLRHREGAASAVETGWIREALLGESKDDAADRRRLHALRAELFAIQRNAPTVMVMEEMRDARATHILLRGAYNAPGEKVDAGVPEALLGPWPESAPNNRLGLAQWLTNPKHPLTARVVVNRFWQQLFGAGLVKTSDNFGFQGEWPSHPELLDWLAVEFVESGWDVKSLLRQIVLSATYRQDSAAPADAYAKDPENRLLARGPRFRLPAEIIRDQALAVSGLLANRVGGPSVFPYQVPDLYKGIVVAADYPGTRYVESEGEDLYRRSLYTFWKRTIPHPAMTVFDAPDREFCIVRRSTTNTPLQSLTLLNDPIYVEAARKLAERAIREGGHGNDGRIAFAFRLSTGRMPDNEEMSVLRTTYEKMLAAYRADAGGSEAFLTIGASRSNWVIDRAELAALAAVTNLILNLDEVVSKG
jgi:hypothetical protein